MYKQKQIQIVLNLTVVGMGILTFISWFIYEDITPVSEAVLTALLKTIKTFVFGIDFDFTTTPPLLKLAAFAAPLCMASTIVFKMVKHVRLVFTGLLIRFFCRNHIILAGSPEFCKALLARGKKVEQKIVVLLSSEYESAQEEFDAFPVYTLCSNLFETRSWKRAGLKRAKNLVLSSGYFDFLDEIKLALQPVLEKRKKALMVNYALSTHRQKVIFSDSKTWFDHKKMDAHSFQFEHMAAMEAVTRYLPHQFLLQEQLSSEAPPSSDRRLLWDFSLVPPRSSPALPLSGP